MKHRSCSTSISTSASARKRGLVPVITLLLATTVPALAQTAQAPAAAPSDSYYSPYELNLFLGYQHFFVNNVLGTPADTFNDSITGGFRITEDFWKYAG